MMNQQFFPTGVLVIIVIFTIATLECQKRCQLTYALGNTRLINHYHESTNITNIKDCENFCLKDAKCDAFNWKVSKAANKSTYDDIRCFLYQNREFSFRSDDADKYTSKVCEVHPLISIGKPAVYKKESSSLHFSNIGLYVFDREDRDKHCAIDIEYFIINLLGLYKIHAVHVWATIDVTWSLQNAIVFVAFNETSNNWKLFGQVSEENEYRYDFGKRIYIVKPQNETATLGKLVRISKKNIQKNHISICQLEIFGVLENLNKNLILLNHTKKDVISTNKNGSDSKLAYDGNMDQLDVNKCFASRGKKSGEALFWRIDLGKDYKVMMVRIYNRGNCCGHHFTSIILSVKKLSDKNWSNCVKFTGVGVTMRIYDFGCNVEKGVSARSVQVATDPTNNEGELIICEVQIYVNPA